MAAGGLEVTTQENLATEPSVTTAGTGCDANAEIPAKKHPPSVAMAYLNLKELMSIRSLCSAT